MACLTYSFHEEDRPSTSHLLMFNTTVQRPITSCSSAVLFLLFSTLATSCRKDKAWSRVISIDIAAYIGILPKPRPLFVMMILLCILLFSIYTHALVSHRGPIMLPIGSHSDPLNVNSKAPMLMKASSTISSNAIFGKMSALVIRDPSSPKVTCLRRVRMEQQSRQNAAKASPIVVDDGNRYERLFTCLVPKLKRREEKVDVEAFASAHTP
ncbi:hypothetical protein L7F22_030282 [Adiantum nelumboides]|nr:hypothetical protein [Adiantum nelumboides]